MRLLDRGKPTKIGRAGDKEDMDYEAFFAGHLGRLRDEGRYRVFAELERIAGALPARALPSATARCATSPFGAPTTISPWASIPLVVEAMRRCGRGSQGSGAGGTRNISGTNTLHAAARARARRRYTASEAALVFTSGYVANETSLADRWARCCRAASSIPTPSTTPR